MEISIIMPVYNSDPYLDGVLENLIQINISGVEFICVDDGSTDDSLQILRRYASKDKRFVICEQGHQGVSVARNQGLALASGTYVMFLDSDDAFIMGTMNRIMSFLDAPADIFMFPHIMCTDGDEKTCLLPTVAQCKTMEELRRAAVESKEINSVWAKVYRRKVILENELRFRPDIKMGEDLIFNLQYLCCTQTFQYCAEPLYVYNIHEGSVTATFDNSRFRDLFEVYKEMKHATDPPTAATVFIDDFLFYLIIGLKFTNRQNIVEVLCRQDIIKRIAKVAENADARQWYKSIFVFLLRKGKMKAVIELYFIRFLIVDFLRSIKIIK